MIRKLRFTVPAEYDGRKAESFLRSEVKLSTRLIRSLKRSENGITLNGEPTRTVDIIRTGDVIGVDIPCPDSDIPPSNIPLEIVYEDDDIIIVNKSPFLACHPTHNHQGDTLANALAGHLLSRGKSTAFRAVGRLDKGTSGLIVCALSKHSAARLQGNIKKEYLAVTEGGIADSGTIDRPIYRPDPGKTLRAVGDSGDRAVTHWQVVERSGSLALLRIRLETGRTHQIRVHMASIGFPLIGDDMYGGRLPELGHQLLHCAKSEFIHPVTGEALCFEAEPPEDMKRVLERGKV